MVYAGAGKRRVMDCAAGATRRDRGPGSRGARPSASTLGQMPGSHRRREMVANLAAAQKSGPRDCAVACLSRSTGRRSGSAGARRWRPQRQPRASQCLAAPRAVRATRSLSRRTTLRGLSLHLQGRRPSAAAAAGCGRPQAAVLAGATRARCARQLLRSAPPRMSAPLAERIPRPSHSATLSAPSDQPPSPPRLGRVPLFVHRDSGPS